jgi:hypothetical protein
MTTLSDVTDLLSEIVAESDKAEALFAAVAEWRATNPRNYANMSGGLQLFFDAIAAAEDLRRDQESSDVEACPGCRCKPGDGRTPGCTDPDGCGYWDALHAD